MTILSLFSVRYAGSESLMDDLCQKTRSRLFRDADIIERCSQKHHIHPAALEKALYAKPSVFNSFTHEKEYATACLRATLADLLETEGQIFTGHTALLLPLCLSHMVRILITAGPEWRLAQARAMDAREREAEEEMARLDACAALWAAHIWDRSPWDREKYHMVLAMDQDSHLLEQVLLTMEKPEFQITETGRWAMEDFRLYARVDLALTRAGHSVHLDVAGGKVRLTIREKSFHPSGLAEELHAIVFAEEGVRDVEICMGPASGHSDVYRKYDPEMGCRILLVDDEREFVQTLSERLRMRNLASHAVCSGEKALELMAEDPPDIMVLDLMMPGISGFRMLEKVRSEYPDIEVIILSGHGTDRDRNRCMDMGAFAYLQKPTDIDELTATMKKAYARVRKKQETGP
ncbi:response regulator [Desulfobotulus sp. H1]|uniref:Response regulator n=1 Tax=Desulfobotulus pelophilus TaxID=2823377 RepID=A0ABT3N945_9BACT|nr:response regulator [Desulfobotulus pelophilus]MCW7753982.1 response regulator [Desulfobotulus pelophilus]